MYKKLFETKRQYEKQYFEKRLYKRRCNSQNLQKVEKQTNFKHQKLLQQEKIVINKPNFKLDTVIAQATRNKKK